MRDKFVSTLTEMAERDSSIVLITGDLGFGVLTDFQKRLPRQFINAGVAEQNMAGLASGMALEGCKVYIYSIANFVFMRCLEQIRNDACYHNANVNVVSVGAGFSYGALGISHHATEDIAIMRALPGATVFCPSDLSETEFATRASAATPGVSYLRLDKSYASTSCSVESLMCGKARTISKGNDVTFVTAGGILEEVLIAAQVLGRDGIQCGVVTLPTVKPLDIDALQNIAGQTDIMITVEEHSVVGGLGGAVAETLLSGDVRPRVFARFGLEDQFSSIVGSQKYLRRAYQLDSDSIVQRTRAILGRNVRLRVA